MPIYMQIQGIDGDVTAKGYEKWIALDSVNFGVTRDIKTRTGNTHDREATLPTVGEMAVGMEMNKTSPNLFTETCVGKAKSVKINICQTSDQAKPYLEYTLSNVLFSNYQVSASTTAEKSTPKETVNLNFDKIEMKYTPYDEKHNAGSPIPAGYDLTTGVKV